MNKRLCLAFIPLMLVGCTQSSELMPLKVGQSWIYESITPIGKNVRTVTVQKRVSVNRDEGYELHSESGITNVVWSHGTLYAGKLAGTLYTPPLPMVRSGVDKAEWNWEGQIRSPLRSVDGMAQGKQEVVDRTVGGHKTKATQVTLTISVGKKKLEVVTWYGAGTGVVGQEERVDGVLVNKLSYVSGP